MCVCARARAHTCVFYLQHLRGNLPAILKMSTVYNTCVFAEELYEEEGVVEVDTTLQEEFFDKVDSQIQSITQFFKKEESGLQFSLSELEDQVSTYMYI